MLRADLDDVVGQPGLGSQSDLALAPGDGGAPGPAADLLGGAAEEEPAERQRGRAH